MYKLIQFLKNLFSESKKGLGAEPNPLDIRDIQLATFQAPIILPYEYRSDISMLPVMDQKSWGSCVGQAEGTAIAYFDYLENKNVDISRRFIYAKCKLIDGIPDLQGTYPRIAGSILSSIGATTGLFVPDDNSLPYAYYLAIPSDSAPLLADAKKRKANFANVGLDLNSLKQAIYQNKMVTVSLYVDWDAWRQAKLKAPNPKNIIGLHRVALFGFKGNEFFGRNSWSESFGDKGNFSFDFLDYVPYILDAIVYTDIPNELLDNAKKQPYYFINTLRKGSRGYEVQKLQERLNIKADGIFGDGTKQAVMLYQSANLLVVDGIWGAKSREKANKPAFMMTPLELAIMKQESGGDLYAIGDVTLVNKAYGCLQIRQGVCDDLNRKNGTKIKSEQMLGNINLSLYVFREWQKIYNLNGTDEEKAKSWNGGAGYKQRIGNPKYATYNKHVENYWLAVKKNLL